MDVKRLNCPNCNAPIDIDPRDLTFNCDYCGSELRLSGDQPTSQSVQTQLRVVIHESRQRAAALKKLRQERQRLRHRYEQARRREVRAQRGYAANETQRGIILLGVGLCGMVIGWVFGVGFFGLVGVLVSGYSLYYLIARAGERHRYNVRSAQFLLHLERQTEEGVSRLDAQIAELEHSATIPSTDPLS